MNSEIQRNLIDGIDCGILYRPTGQPEMELVSKSGFTKWPPRLPEQPIFYPVTNQAYAREIALKWNTKDSNNGNIGYVTKFSIRWSFLSQFKVETVGARIHTELWIPADMVDEMNANIVGFIEVLEVIAQQDNAPDAFGAGNR